MTVENAYRRGANAFRRGIDRYPTEDVSFVAALGINSSFARGSVKPFCEAWLRGWDDNNHFPQEFVRGE